MMESIDRKKEIVNNCLELLVEKGLTQTTTRDLSKAMKLKSGGMYYYFASKDELIIACAEEAVIRVENKLFTSALKDTLNPKQMIARLQENAVEMSPTMKFFVSVCTDKRYAESMKPVLERVSKRYLDYACKFAESIDVDEKEITPFIYMMITAISNYMVFGEESFVSPQLRAVQIKFERVIVNSQPLAIKEQNRSEYNGNSRSRKI